jgi:hypothetical protein
MMTLFDQPWTLFGVFLVVLLVLVEIGFAIGSLLAVSSDQLRHEQLVGARDGITVLLSLLLGFTLAMALSRYDQRKLLIVEEANAIGTLSQRAQLLPDAARGKMLDLLHQYVDTRILFSAVPLQSREFDAVVARGKQLQNQMWQQSVEVARQNPTPITALFIAALNESFDMSERECLPWKTAFPGQFG